MNSKYSNLLTVLLVIVIIAIIGIIGFLGYKYYKSSTQKDSAEDFVDSFLNDSNISSNNNNNENNTNITENTVFEGAGGGNTTGGSSTSGGNTTQKYKGFIVSGSIEIPATSVKLPILAPSALSPAGLETSVIEIYGDGLNEVGNTTIMGHNYRNGQFFSNNKKLNIGDKIFITDLSGRRLSYTIYNKYETDIEDSDYINRNTEGAVEISLSTCTDDSKARLIIWAKADI